MAGPGHSAPGVLGPVYLEGTYSEIYPNKSQDVEGMRRFFKDFSFPGGIGSHCTPETPGSIHEGGDTEVMHQKMAGTLEDCVLEIRRIQQEARATGQGNRAMWPMIVLRSPKGWTGPKEVDGHNIEGSWRSHQVPLGYTGESGASERSNSTPAAWREKRLKLTPQWLSVAPSGAALPFVG